MFPTRILALATAVSLALAGCVNSRQLHLCMGSRQARHISKRIPVSAGDRFYLDYVHSSEKTPIHDVFRVDENGSIVLVEERFSWYAVGLEFCPRYGGATIRLDGKETRVELERRFPVLPIRLGWMACHVVTVGSRRYALNDLAPSGARLELWIE